MEWEWAFVPEAAEGFSLNRRDTGNETLTDLSFEEIKELRFPIDSERINQLTANIKPQMD